MQDYTVKPGDSLSIIARDVLGDITRWKEIADLNKITNVNLIHPGDVLTLPDWVYKEPSSASTTDKMVKSESSNSSAMWGLGFFLVVLGTAAVVIRQHRKKKMKTAA
jgi:LysM repeat protein